MPMPVYRSNEHMVEQLLPQLQEAAQSIRAVL